MRKRISEQNVFPNFDLYSEYQKINNFISKQCVIGTFDRYGNENQPTITIEKYINDLCFLDWNLRGTFLSIYEMREGLGVADKNIKRHRLKADQILDFLQYAINCMHRVNQTIYNCAVVYIYDINIIDSLITNIRLLVEKLHCTIVPNINNTELCIIYDDPKANVVAADNPDINDSIIEYKKIDNRGDLTRKAEVLCTLYKTLESYSDLFKGTTYNSLYNDTKLLFNKSGVRHNVDKDAIACATFNKMNPEELEEWYDKVFNMFLSCMVTKTYLEDKPEIEAIKKSIGD